jgi:hypothetical protein
VKGSEPSLCARARSVRLRDARLLPFGLETSTLTQGYKRPCQQSRQNDLLTVHKSACYHPRHEGAFSSSRNLRWPIGARSSYRRPGSSSARLELDQQGPWRRSCRILQSDRGSHGGSSDKVRASAGRLRRVSRNRVATASESVSRSKAAVGMTLVVPSCLTRAAAGRPRQCSDSGSSSLPGPTALCPASQGAGHFLRVWS